MEGKKFFYWLGYIEAQNFRPRPSALDWNLPTWALIAKTQGWTDCNCAFVNNAAKKLVFK